MNMNIIYEPYVFSFILSLIFSIIYYVYERNKIDDYEEEDENPKDNLLSKSIIALLLSYIIIMILYYSYKYVTFEFKSTIPLMGGAATHILQKENNKNEGKNIEELNERREKMMERLTIIDDDVDVSILED